MGGLVEFVSTLISVIQSIVSDELSIAARRLGFNKEGQIQNEVIGNFQQSYSDLEDKIGQAYLQQQTDVAAADARKKVIAGNIVSIIGAVLLVLMVVILMYVVTSKKK